MPRPVFRLIFGPCRLAMFFLVLAFGFFPARGLAEEVVHSFDSRVVLAVDGSMTVAETIRVRAEGRDIRRGIYRDFPTSYSGPLGLSRKVGFTVLKALRNGRKVHVFTKYLSNGVRVYMGHPEETIRPGTYEYVLVYRTDRQMRFLDDRDRLYWNVTGQGWSFPIEKASCEILLPRGAIVLSTDAFTGSRGDRGRNWRQWRPVPGRVAFETTAGLMPRQGLSVIVDMQKGSVAEAGGLVPLLADNGLLLAALAGLLLSLGAYLWAWYRVGRDPRAGHFAPLFGPPPDMSPAAARYVFRMGYDETALAAALINMAVKGYLTIDDSGGKTRLTRTGANMSALSGEEVDLAGQLFAGKDSVTLDTSARGRIKKARKDFIKTLKRDWQEGIFEINRSYLVPGAILSLLAVAAMIFNSAEIGAAAFICFWLAVWGGVSLFLAQGAVQTRNIAAWIIAGLFCAFWFMGAFMLAMTAGWAGMAVFAGAGFMLALFRRLMRAPTAHGRRLMDGLDGFRLFLSVSEKDRLNLLNPPSRTPELFEEFLPYALALGVEQQWGELFAETLAKAGADGSGYNPSWYHGANFSPSSCGSFASSIGSNLAGAMVSSSSSGGGGGGAGGGGGGGGGGGF